MPKRKLKCHDCTKELKSEKERKIRLDPFQLEIKNKQVRGRWCNGCYKKMLQEI